MPTLMRFGGRFNSSDFVAGTDGLGLFLDYPSIAFSFYEQSTDVIPQITNQVGCGAVSSSILCTVFSLSNALDVTGISTVVGTPDINDGQYIHFMQLIVFKGTYTGVDEFNHYVPIKPVYSKSPYFANVACLKESTTMGVWDIKNLFI